MCSISIESAILGDRIKVSIMNINGNSVRTYDAIVVGSGISGGWAAMELCKKGLKTLLLERGRNVEHIKDYHTANLAPWEFENGFNNTQEDIANDPIQCQAYNPATREFFIRDKEHPYIQDKPFNWFRGYQVGGRSLTWGRQCYRWSDLDFGANLKDGHGIDWPIRYKDIEPWYDYVESFVGISGKKEYLRHLPDGKFLPPMELNCIEKHLADSLKKNEEKRILTIARIANLTKGWNGRNPCMNRNLCQRGCPYGGYFSSNSSTIPAAMATGNLTLRPYSIVKEVVYNDAMRKATGIVIVDAVTQEHIEFKGKIIFLNASTINTAAILLNSKSRRFPNGLGNDSGQLGHNLMDHHSSAGASGIHDGFKDKYYKGRRPCGYLIARYRNLDEGDNLGFVRGYNIQGRGERQEWRSRMHSPGFGADYKRVLTTPGPWRIWMGGWGECLPYYGNRVYLDETETDKWGSPLIRINFSFGENERTMMDDIKNTSMAMLKTAGFTNIDGFNYNKPGGSTIHEMGTARMGKNPETSVLNRNNQLHSVKNVFITDGSCMTSSACQNPSLTYMALTARAVDYAVSNYEQIKTG